MKRAIFLALIVFATGGFSELSYGTLAVYEGFDMGDTSGPLEGMSGDTSVGFLPGSTWDSDISTGTPTNYVSYVNSGLSFSDMPVTGGKVYLSVSNSNMGSYRSAEAWRRLGSTFTGTIYGSYLVYHKDYLEPLTQGFVGVERHIGHEKQFSAGWKGHNWKGSVAMDSSSYEMVGTTAPRYRTNLVIYKVDGLVAEGAGNASQSITSWILSESQYDHFKTYGLTEDELNLAVIGSESTNVLQRGTLSTMQDQHCGIGDWFGISNSAYGYMTGLSAYYDELRISDSSINEAVGLIVPEPGTMCLLGLGGLVLRKRK